MATAIYVQDGRMVDYTPGSDVDAGDVVVQEDLVGIAAHDIDSGELGALAVQGVFQFPKSTGSGTAISAGANCYWDATNTVATTSAGGGTNKLIGKAVAAAATSASTVNIRLNQ